MQTFGMDPESSENLGEERRRRVKKKRRVTRLTVAGKEVKGDFLKNPSTLEFPDPGRRYRKLIVAVIIVIFLAFSALLFMKVGDIAPSDVNATKGAKP